jgi:hypothetical protein
MPSSSLKVLALALCSFSVAVAQVQWSNPWNQSTTPSWTGWTRLQYDPVTQRTWGWISNVHTFDDIYANALYKWHSSGSAWTEVFARTVAVDDKCPAETSSQPMPGHPYNTFTAGGNGLLWMGTRACNNATVATMFYFDTDSGTWNQVDSTGMPSYYSGAWTWDKAHRVIIAVQRNSGDNATTTHVYAPTLRNPTPGTLTAAQQLATGATADAWAQVTTNTPPDGAVIPLFVWDSISRLAILYGGYSSHDASGAKAETWVYDPEAATWTNKAPAVAPGTPSFSISLAGYAGDIAPNGKLYFIRPAASTELWSYTVASNAWSQETTSGTPPRDPITAAYDASTNRLVAWGYTAIAFAKVFEAQLPSLGTTGVSFRGSLRMK